jgi:H+/Cl- antiporter ClcA
MMGIFGGALGSLFINVNTRMTVLRKKYVTKNWIKVVETGCFAVMTVSAYVIFTSAVGGCLSTSEMSTEEISELRRWTCPENEYNPLATLFFNTEGGTIRSLFNDEN